MPLATNPQEAKLFRLILSDDKARIMHSVFQDLPPLDMFYGPWCAGGIVRRIFMGEDLGSSDIDIWLPRDEDLANLFVAAVEEKFGSPAEMTPYNSTYVTTDRNVQIMHKYHYGAITDVINKFAVTCCQWATDGIDIWATQSAVNDSRDRIFRIVDGPRLSKNLRTKYLDHYGFREPEGQDSASMVDQSCKDDYEVMDED